MMPRLLTGLALCVTAFSAQAQFVILDPAQTAPAQAPAQPAAPSLDDLESSLTASPSTPSQGGTPTEASHPNPAPQP